MYNIVAVVELALTTERKGINMESILFHVSHKGSPKGSQTKSSTLSASGTVEQPGPLFEVGLQEGTFML